MGKAGKVTRNFISDLKRRVRDLLRLLASDHAYRIPASARIFPASGATRLAMSRAGSAWLPNTANGCSEDYSSCGSHLIDIGNAECMNGTYPSDQYSQIEISPTAILATQWAGVAVRIREGGRDAYVGVCKINNGKSELMIFKRMHGKWTRLASTDSSGQLPADTQLRLIVVGSTIVFMENGVIRISAGDNSLSGGVPGIMVNGSVEAGRLSAGPTGFEVHHVSNDSLGIATYSVISATNSGGPRLLRVLRPANPKPGMAHNFLFVLPVEEGLKGTYGNGLQTMQSLDVQNEYNLTVIEPSFGIQPWYADNPRDPDVRYETFMVRELIPWVRENLVITGIEQSWLIGFSKSGVGGQGLLLKHPDLFALAASWDFPADMSSYDDYGLSSADCYGTDANFQANYRLTSHFVSTHKPPFLQNLRIWIGKGMLFRDDVSRYESMLASEGVLYLTEAPVDIPHRWDSGWVPTALDALHKCSIELSRAQDLSQ
jgi:Putative esterase